jgi:hypothetical protein
LLEDLENSADRHDTELKKNEIERIRLKDEIESIRLTDEIERKRLTDEIDALRRQLEEKISLRENDEV